MREPKSGVKLNPTGTSSGRKPQGESRHHERAANQALLQSPPNHEALGQQLLHESGASRTERIRTAISRRRLVARANKQVATFAQAISNTIDTSASIAPRITVSTLSHFLVHAASRDHAEVEPRVPNRVGGMKLRGKRVELGSGALAIDPWLEAHCGVDACIPLRQRLTRERLDSRPGRSRRRTPAGVEL